MVVATGMSCSRTSRRLPTPNNGILVGDACGDADVQRFQYTPNLVS